MGRLGVMNIFGIIGLVMLAGASAVAETAPNVVTLRVPHEGIQPQAVVGVDHTVHLIYYRGDATAGDIFYCERRPADNSFTAPLQINSQPSSGIAIGTIRGAHLALGRDGRVHVAWNGSGKAMPRGLPNPELPKDSPYRLSAPMLYSRMNSNGTGFEPQRNLMTHTYSLDGGGSLAADSTGNIYAVWHANTQTSAARGEANRAVWMATSYDDGENFSAETRINTADTGACGCCGLRAGTDESGRIMVLYRSAEQTVHRDMRLLLSTDHGQHFGATMLDAWDAPQCVMSSASLSATNGQMFAAWETEQQVKFARVDQIQDSNAPLRVMEPSRSEASRKHPSIAVNRHGQVILVWTEGTGWQRGGTLAWQVFDRDGKPLPDGAGRQDGIPVWSFAAVYVDHEDRFTIVY